MFRFAVAVAFAAAVVSERVVSSKDAVGCRINPDTAVYIPYVYTICTLFLRPVPSVNQVLARYTQSQFVMFFKLQEYVPGLILQE